MPRPTVDASDMVPPMAELREIATGLHFPEGPVAMSDGSVIVVEIGAGTVTRVAADGSKEEVARPGGGPNGAAIGPDGNLYVCNNGAAFDYLELPGMEGIVVPRQPPSNYSRGRIERIDLGSGAVEVIYEECDGRPLRAPNDLVFDGHGGFYFTDHGLREERMADRTGVFYAQAGRLVDPRGGASARLAQRARSVAGRLAPVRRGDLLGRRLVLGGDRARRGDGARGPAAARRRDADPAARASSTSTRWPWTATATSASGRSAPAASRPSARRTARWSSSSSAETCS